VRAYYVPAAKARLLSPQKLQVGICPLVEVPYCRTSGLPIGEALCGPQIEPRINVSVLDEENTHLSPGKKLLLEWHYRFGQLNFSRVKKIIYHVPFVAHRFAAAVKDDAPKCYVCQLAKQTRRSKQSTLHKVVSERDGYLKDGIIMKSAPWTAAKIDKTIKRGPHNSTSQKLLAAMMRKHQWTLITASLACSLKGLRVSPIDVVPHCDCRPRMTVDYSFYDVNDDTTQVAPNE
jgi:hypothetical protein